MRRLLYSPTSLFARKVRIVLAELALEHEADLVEGRRSPGEMAPLNPNLTIPVLIDGAQTLFESNLIMEYLLGRYAVPAAAPAPPLLPTLTRPEHHWADAKVLATLDAMAYAAMTLRQLARSGVDATGVAWLERHQARIAAQLDWLERLAGPQGFAPGWFSAMDINLICYLDFIEQRHIVALSPHPRLNTLRACFAERPSVRETAPPG